MGKLQTGIKIAGRNINNLRYADDTTLIAESEEDLKSFLMSMKEESLKAGLKPYLKKERKKKKKLRSWHPVAFSQSVQSLSRVRLFATQ